MIRGKTTRYLILLVVGYIFVSFYFLRSVDSDSNETTTDQAHFVRKRDENPDEMHVVEPVASRKHIIDKPWGLEPIMTPGVLGNYEPQNMKRIDTPGENGQGVALKGEEIKLGEKSVADYGFNEVASDKISLDRHARDTR